MYNLRQLVILLVAVFIALGLGIAIGFSANSDNLLVEQQRIALDKLEKDFLSLKALNRLREAEYKNALNQQESVFTSLDKSFKVIAEDALQAKRIIVLSPNKKCALQLEKYLLGTGAKVVSALLKDMGDLDALGLDFGIDSPAPEEDVFSGGPGGTGEKGEGPTRPDLVADLCIIYGEQNHVAPYLLEVGSLQFNKTLKIIKRPDMDLHPRPADKDTLYIQDLNKALDKFTIMSFLIDNFR